MPLTPGTRLGVYEVTAQIGAGGMGEVYRACDTKLGRHVALKILPDTFTHDPERLARFRREAQVLASLNHPHIGAIYGLDETDDQQFLVLELVDGESLDKRIAHGPIPVDEALVIAKQIAEALEAAHDKGIIHRDLKPANIAVTHDGTVKVLDFGLAKATEAAGATSLDLANSPTITTPAMMTGVGMILGTAAYMSPEQAKGRPADKRSDVWAFGCVVYEMLTGRRAFDGDTVAETLAAVLKVDVEWAALPPLPPSINRLLRRCLEKDAKRRLDSVAAARLDIEDALAPEPPGAAAVSPRARRAARFVPVALVLAVVLPVVAISITSFRATARQARSPVAFSVMLPPGFNLDNAYPAFAVSPIGNALVVAAFPNNRATDGRLWRRNLDSDQIALIQPIDETASQPFFFPDGKRFGFINWVTSELKVVDGDGHAPRTVARIANARRIAGVTVTPHNEIVFSHPSAGSQFHLKRVAAAGGAPVIIAEPDTGHGEMGLLWPHVLPDGDHVLVTVSHTSGRYSVEAVSVKDASRRKVLDDAFAGQYRTTGHLVFFRPLGVTGAISNGSAMAIPFDASTLSVHGDAENVSTGIQSRMLAESPGVDMAVGGGTIAMVPTRNSEAGEASIGWLDATGAFKPLGAPPMPYRHLDLSRDGTKIAVGVDGNRDVYLYDIPRNVLTRFTTDPEEDETPRWSPDGTHVVWAAYRNGKVHVFLAPADGSSPEQTLWSTTDHVHINGWQTDGKVLFLNVRTGSNENISTYSFDDRRVRPFISTPVNEYGAAPSPDGQLVAYVSEQSGSAQVFVRSLRNSGQIQVSSVGAAEPVWSHDGRQLFFKNRQTSELDVVDVPSTAPLHVSPSRALLKLPTWGLTRDPTYAVAPDGRVLVIRPNQETGTTTVLKLLIQ